MYSSDNNSILKNHMDTDADHPEPRIRGSRDNDSNDDNTKKSESLLDQIKDLKTDTQTDYLLGYFVNKDKQVPDSEIRLPNEVRDRSDSPSDSHYDKDDHKRYSDSDDHKKDYPQPKPSNAGPSYGPDSDNYDRDRDRSRHHDSEFEFESKEEEMLAKLDMLRKLGELTKYHGVVLSQRYSMDSDYRAMKYEYELHKSVRDKANGVKWLSNLMLNGIYGLEFLNENFNPFDFHLDGWSEQMQGEAKDYQDVLGEIYEKYFRTGKPIPPEIKLFFMISGSAIQFHLAHTMMKGFKDLGSHLDGNPDLAEQLRQQAAADRMRKNFDTQQSAFDQNRDKEDLCRDDIAELLSLKELFGLFKLKQIRNLL